MYFLVVLVNLAVSTSAVSCLERLFSDMTYCMSSGTLNSAYFFTRLLIVELELVVGRPTAVRENPGSNLTAAGRVYHDSHCDVQPWARVVHPYCSA